MNIRKDVWLLALFISLTLAKNVYTPVFAFEPEQIILAGII